MTSQAMERAIDSVIEAAIDDKIQEMRAAQEHLYHLESKPWCAWCKRRKAAA